MKALDTRADKIGKKKWQAKWHEAEERMRIAIGYLALGDSERALALVRPAMALRGRDTYGDTIEWCARDAIALGLRLEPGNKGLAKQFVEVGKIIDKEFEKPGTWLAKPKPKAWAKLADEAVHLDLDKALWHVNHDLYACFVAMAQDPASAKTLEPVVEKILAAIASLLGGTTKPAAVGAAVDLGKLQERADREPHPLLRERLQAMAWLGKKALTTQIALDVAVAYLALGRSDDARLFANAVLRDTNPKQHDKNNEYTGALALLIEAGDASQLELFEDTNSWAWDDGAKAWQEFADDLDASGIEEKGFPSALRNARGVILQSIGGTHLPRAKKVATRLRKALDGKLFPALRKRLASKPGAALANLVRSFGPPRSPSLKPLPAALDPKRENVAALKKLLARVASKPALRGGSTTQDVLVVGLGRAALGRDADAIATLDTLADLGFSGDYDTWYIVGMAITVRARLSADPKRDLPRLAWEPFASIDDDWLDQQADRVRAFPAQAAECATSRPSDRVFGRLAGGLAWTAFATVSPDMKSRVTKQQASTAWTAGLDALRALLDR